MKNNIKKLSLAVIIIVSVGLCFVYYQRESFKTQLPNQIQGLTTQEIEVWQTLAYGKEKLLTKSAVEEGITALNLLKKTYLVKTQGEGKNAFVIEINKVGADSHKREFWAFYVNGQMSEVGAGSYQLKNGDKIEWKLETY